LESIIDMIICHYPTDTRSETRWEPSEAAKQLGINEGDTPDSCVFLYWAYLRMSPGDKREMAFTYGLGKIAVDAREVASDLGLTAGGAFRPGGIFTVTAYVKNSKEGQKATLKLPDGVHFIENQQPTQDVPLAGGKAYSQVSWRVKADATGEYKLTATSDEKTVGHSVRIKSSGLFD
jgi:hypothetical protein